jgi:hypothetical protein
VKNPRKYKLDFYKARSHKREKLKRKRMHVELYDRTIWFSKR